MPLQAFAAVRLQSHRLVDFVRERRHVLRRLTLTNSEGYWVRGPVVQRTPAQPLAARMAGSPVTSCSRQTGQSQLPHCCWDMKCLLPCALPTVQADDGEFVALASKHTFNLGTLGILLGMLGQLEGEQQAACVVGGV